MAVATGVEILFKVLPRSRDCTDYMNSVRHYDIFQNLLMSCLPTPNKQIALTIPQGFMLCRYQAQLFSRMVIRTRDHL
jgi:hypothetical protein